MRSDSTPEPEKQQPKKHKKKPKQKPRNEARREINSLLPAIQGGRPQRKEERSAYSDFLRWFLDLLSRF